MRENRKKSFFSELINFVTCWLYALHQLKKQGNFHNSKKKHVKIIHQFLSIHYINLLISATVVSEFSSLILAVLGSYFSQFPKEYLAHCSHDFSRVHPHQLASPISRTDRYPTIHPTMSRTKSSF